MTRLVLDRVVEGSRMGAAPGQQAALYDRAAERGVLPILYRYASWRGESPPESAKEQWRRHVARLALYRRELSRTVAVLGKLGPVVVLKGEPLARLLFGDALMRNTTDMDLLITPDRVGEAVRVLEPLGYLPMHDARAKPWTYNQLALIHRQYGTVVELHWRIAFPHLPSPPAKQLLAETTPVAVDSNTYRTLRPELLFLHLCYHFHQHRGFLKGLLDITGWLDRFEDSADLEEIAQIADRLGVGGVLQWPLHTLAHFAGYRSRLMRHDVDMCVRSWAAYSSAKLEREFVELRPTGAVGRFLDEQSFGAKLLTSIAQGLSMTVADGWHRKATTAIKPVILGPHRLGRAVFSSLERLGAVDRDDLYVGRIWA
ncbi:MAG: nucleotidyltransferase family protein [Persicimonas sp.]